MRLLRLDIHEPHPGNVLPHIAASHGADEAARRYKAIVLTTLRQLRGLSDSCIEIHCTPDDAVDAIRFWLLPRLADHWQQTSGHFVSDGWQITFAPQQETPSIRATGHILCPWLSARWVHTAMLGLDRGTHHAIGLSPCGEPYFEARANHAADPLEHRPLPPLQIIKTDADWQDALKSPLGPAIKKAWEAEQ